MNRLFLLLLLAIGSIARAEPATVQADRAALLNGITEITSGGAQGPIAVFGPEAFAVVAGKDGKDVLAPVVAATRLGRGRVVAFGHGSFLEPAADAKDTLHLIENSLQWTSGAALGKPKVAVHKNGALLARLKADGIDAEALDGDGWAKKLPGYRALISDSHGLGDADLAAVSQFVRDGGGLITSGLGWGWQQLNAKLDLATDHPGNRLLAAAGLVWSQDTLEHTGAHGYTAGGANLNLLNATDALAALSNATEHHADLGAAALGQASATLARAMRSLPPTDKLLLPSIAALATKPGASDFPTPEKPLKAENALGRLMVARDLQLLAKARPDQLRAHPAAAAFPGAVPIDAPRISNRQVAIDAAHPGWHSTGLYAPPGALVTVVVPAPAAGKGLSVRIGCHNDSLWHLPSWHRAPEICRVDKIKDATTPTASAFGGLLYIETPSDASSLGVFNVAISGAVETPRFVLGKTSLSDWRSHLRQAPGPWAELETSKVILSVPSKDIRTLDDPEALLKFWDQVLDAEADLATIPRERTRPERIVADVQISAGYMHSGYPIMTPLDSVANAVQLDRLRAGSWGHFHELGHNHQQSPWTFDGTVEVTCNLFSLYVSETLCGQPPGQGHDAMKPVAVDKRLRGYLSSPDFARWKSDPFLALIMYNQLRAAFGWETYKKLFAEYRALPKAELPKTEDEKRDQWMVRFSRATGKNLGPFFVAWGVPTSQQARDSIKDLAAWMPADWPGAAQK